MVKKFHISPYLLSEYHRDLVTSFVWLMPLSDHPKKLSFEHTFEKPAFIVNVTNQFIYSNIVGETIFLYGTLTP